MPQSSLRFQHISVPIGQNAGKLACCSGTQGVCTLFLEVCSRVLDEDDPSPPDTTTFDAESVQHSKPHSYTHPTWLPQAKPPILFLKSESIQLEEVSFTIKQASSSSLPSPINQIPYLVFKRCSLLLSAFVNLYNLCQEVLQFLRHGRPLSSVY